MTKEQIRQKYLQSIESLICKSETYAENEKFDQLVALYETSYGYSLFYPMNKNISFTSICELYGRLINEDGDCSLVVCEFDFRYDHNLYLDLKEIFVINESRHELNYNRLCNILKVHRGECSTIFLNSYSAINFNWDVLQFLNGLNKQMKISDKIGEKMNNDKKYYKTTGKIYNKIIKFIKSNPDKIEKKIEHKSLFSKTE